MYNYKAKDGSTGRKAIMHVEGQKHGAWLQGLENSSSRQVGKWKQQRRGWAGEINGVPSMGMGNGPNHNTQSISDSQLPRQIYTYAFVGKVRQISSVNKVIYIKLFVDFKKRI